MKRSNRLVLLIGVFLAALAFVFVIVLLGGGGGTSGNPNASAPPAKIATVLAARDIALGVTISKDMVKMQDLDPGVRAAGTFQDVSLVIGQVARASLKNGQQITAAAFAEGSGVNLQCPAGFACMSIQVDQVSGVGTLVKTGDYVDLVAQISPASFPLNYFINPQAVGAPVPVNDPTSVKVLLQGIQVVSTILPPTPTTETGVATPAPGSVGTSLNGQQEILIVAVTTQQAEVIKFAQVDGNLTVMLRSPQDFVDADGNPVIPQTVSTTGIVLKTLVDSWGVLPPTWIIVPGPSPLP